jgi:hypothetical protein
VRRRDKAAYNSYDVDLSTIATHRTSVHPGQAAQQLGPSEHPPQGDGFATRSGQAAQSGNRNSRRPWCQICWERSTVCASLRCVDMTWPSLAVDPIHREGPRESVGSDGDLSEAGSLGRWVGAGTYRRCS